MAPHWPNLLHSFRSRTHHVRFSVIKSLYCSKETTFCFVTGRLEAIVVCKLHDWLTTGVTNYITRMNPVWVCLVSKLCFVIKHMQEMTWEITQNHVQDMISYFQKWISAKSQRCTLFVYWFAAKNKDFWTSCSPDVKLVWSLLGVI